MDEERSISGCYSGWNLHTQRQYTPGEKKLEKCSGRGLLWASWRSLAGKEESIAGLSAANLIPWGRNDVPERLRQGLTLPFNLRYLG